MAEHRDYERTDVSIRVAVWSAVILSVMILVVGGALALLRLQFEGAADVFPQRPPLVRQGQIQPPLQENPQMDLEELRAHVRKILTTAAWLDEDRTAARIPIDDAMEMLAEQGWPEGAP
ncbi:hypothetical protein C882_0358 [Caenispirillum salinarum AK4]|uniref:Uncharacterized protein n=1 Tax=Caenispirillum salinarum AK4 TaxID=1238182 RepID=K9HLV7_9PROT|nr:hypothetical protein [Caenispirillum salinarum]EKV29536.1 hypothetical protein C882_0358 [Caenispirillum salinarum AK4]